MRAIGLMVLLSGCSLLGLDDVEPQACAMLPVADLTSAHAQCAAELGGATLGMCEAHVCAEQIDDALFCTIAAPDADGDGVGAMECVTEGPRDCDDSDPAVAEGRDELCDGKDNDCDGRTDEGVLVATEPMMGAGVGERAGVVGVGRSGETLLAAYRSGATLHLFNGMRGDDLDVALTNPTGEADDRGFGVVGDGTRSFVVYPRAGCLPFLSLGVAQGGVTEATERLPDDAGNTCDTGSSPQRAPAVTFDGTTGLVVWLESMLKPGCGSGGTVPLRAARLSSDGSLSEPFTVGEANDADAPSVLAESGRVIVAFGNGSNLHIVGVEGTTVGDALVVDAGGYVAATDIALGETDDTRANLAVAFSAGCGTNASVGLQRASFGRSDTTLSGGEMTMAVSEGAQENPSVAFGTAMPRGYLLAWRESDRVRAQLLGEDTEVAGDAIDVLDPQDFDGTAPSALRGVGVSAIAAGGFDVLVHVTGSQTHFHTTFVGCGG